MSENIDLQAEFKRVNPSDIDNEFISALLVEMHNRADSCEASSNYKDGGLTGITRENAMDLVPDIEVTASNIGEVFSRHVGLTLAKYRDALIKDASTRKEIDIDPLSALTNIIRDAYVSRLKRGEYGKLNKVQLFKELQVTGPIFNQNFNKEAINLLDVLKQEEMHFALMLMSEHDKKAHWIVMNTKISDVQTLEKAFSNKFGQAHAQYVADKNPTPSLFG